VADNQIKEAAKAGLKTDVREDPVEKSGFFAAPADTPDLVKGTGLSNSIASLLENSYYNQLELGGELINGEDLDYADFYRQIREDDQVIGELLNASKTEVHGQPEIEYCLWTYTETSPDIVVRYVFSGMLRDFESVDNPEEHGNTDPYYGLLDNTAYHLLGNLADRWDTYLDHRSGMEAFERFENQRVDI